MRSGFNVGGNGGVGLVVISVVENFESCGLCHSRARENFSHNGSGNIHMWGEINLVLAGSGVAG